MTELFAFVGVLFAAYWFYRFGIRKGSRNGYSAGRRKVRSQRR